VVVSQPAFIYYHGDRYLAEVGPETQKWLYPFKSLIAAGVCLAAGSDSPVVPLNPIQGIHAAVTRLSDNGRTVLGSEAVTPRQALAIYTANAAFASFAENTRGTLSPGLLADIVVLSGDPLSLPVELIKDIQVEMTFIGGQLVWPT
jgi:predicted amidohydrolase YtcJ